jgi:dTDP-glucose 4,6-dehydratase
VFDKLRPDMAPHARQIQFVTDRPGHDRRYAIDSSKLERELGWRPTRDFVDGVERTVRWYLENEYWWKPLRESGRIGERLGLSVNG